MNILTIILVTISAIFGSVAQAAQATTTQASTQAIQASTQATTCEEDMPCWDCETMGNLVCGQPAQCEEDMPCWDCETMGNLTCGVMNQETARDAWASYDALESKPSDSTTATTVSYSHTLTSSHTPSYALTIDQVAIPSVTDSHAVHVFTIVPTV